MCSARRPLRLFTPHPHPSIQSAALHGKKRSLPPKQRSLGLRLVLLHGAASWGSHPPCLSYLQARRQITPQQQLSPSKKRLRGGEAKSFALCRALTRCSQHPKTMPTQHKPSPLSPRSSHSIPHPFTFSPPAQHILVGGGKWLQGHPVTHRFTPMQFGTKTPARAAPLLTLLCQPSPPGSHGMEMHKPNPARHGPEMGAYGHGALINPCLRLVLASL